MGASIEDTMKKDFTRDTGISAPSTLYEGKPVKDYDFEIKFLY